jgi:hypothetical protein
MSNIDNLTIKANQLFDSNINWNGVVVSKKEVQGVETQQPCLTLFVEKKLPLSDIPQEDLFPSSVEVDGVTYATDVVEVPSLSATGCYTLPDPSTPQSTWQMPVSGSRVEHRPLVGGISVGTIPPDGWGGSSVDTGTLGGLAVDLEDYTIVGVSNNHVLSKNTLAGNLGGAFTNDFGLTFWTYLSVNDTTSSPGDDRYPVYQRSTYDKFTVTQSLMQPLTVGTVKKAYPFKSSGNRVDVCSFALSGTHTLNLSGSSTNWQQYQLDISQPMDWATDSEINSLLTTELGAPVFRSGRTEGPVGWPGSDPYGFTCRLSAYSIGGANVSYGGNIGVLGFEDQIFFRGNSSSLSPSSGGDSGSFVCALFNSTNPALSAWKVIGLNFAGNGVIGVANKITNVANMFNLSAYKGDEIDIGYKGYDMQVISSRQSALTAMIGGKMYWQAGSTGFPATTSFDP